jgi:hypothetical protein
MVVATMLAAEALCPSQAQAEVPARFYWKSLSGGDAVPVIGESISGNTNPFDSAHQVTGDADMDATMVLAGYAHTFSLFDRSAMGLFLVPMGRVSSDVTVAGRTTSESANGFGDPMFEFDINLIGPPAQKTLADAARYEPGFSVDLLADLAVPIGQYDSEQSLNIGQNRWYGRIGAPIILQLGPWVPGRRTTLEFMPSVWFFSNNDDFMGQTLETDPMFELDGHLTRDLTERLWGSLDFVWFDGGGSTINGVSGDSLNNFGAGFTLGYQINENLNMTFGYKSTFTSPSSTDLRMDVFMISLVYGWHPIIEGARRLDGGE